MDLIDKSTHYIDTIALVTGECIGGPKVPVGDFLYLYLLSFLFVIFITDWGQKWISAHTNL